MGAKVKPIVLLLSLLILLTAPLFSQSQMASLSGVVSDTTGGVIPGAEVVLINVGRSSISNFITDDQGRYTFQALSPGQYELRATMAGFKEYVQTGIELNINMKGRVDVVLQVGEVTESVEVVGTPSQLNFENATREEGISPDALQKLPLLVSGTVRSAAGFAVLMPGVSTGGSNNAFDARINGGIQSGDEATVDGVSMQQGTMSQSGMISIFQDFPFSPDMVSEVKVLTSNYEPQYGGTSGATIVAETKSGSNEFHGAGFWFHRNTKLNARQFGAEERPTNLQNNYGWNIGGPAKIPGIWSDKVKTFFYLNNEYFKIRGGSVAPIVSIPTSRNRIGDFSDWRDGDGNLIPIFDPDTLRPNPDYDPDLGTSETNLPFLRDQFMGCDGNSPNVICSDRIANSWAKAWFDYLPAATWDDRPLNNYQGPAVPDGILADTAYWFWRIDTNIGDSDHVYWSSWSQWTGAKYNSVLPQPIANESISEPQNSWVNRLNWTHTYSPTLIHHFSIGYLNRNEGYGSMNQDFVDDFPKVPGVAGEIFGYTSPPEVNFGNGYRSYGNSTGFNLDNVTTRPTVVGNILFTWVRNDHTIKFGAEYRNLGQNFHDAGNLAGSFSFDSGTTGLRGINSGNSMASFLLEQVDSASSSFRTVDAWYARQAAYALYAGDTWKITPKLTLNYGLRWDFFTPAWEKYNQLSFFDPTLQNNSGPMGALAFADEFEQRNGRRYPDEDWKGGWAPRLGVAYTWDDKTVIRAGYGIFYHQAYCQGWGGCMNLSGYNTTPSFNSSNEGLEAAFVFSDGFPQDFNKPPFLENDFQNGQGIYYRGFNANKRAYSQQWNLTIERELMKDFMLSVAYVGNKGTRLPSYLAPANAINPSLLSRGETLNQVFNSDDQVIDGVGVPYPGWVDEMTGCDPNVAQALQPYPQYCGNIDDGIENAGYSNYHSFQLKADKRFSEGTFLLVSYTAQKLLTTSQFSNEASGTEAWGGYAGTLSPFERQRAKALAVDDVPQIISISFIYDLPGNSLDGPARWFLGGWTMNTIFRYSKGIPFYFRSGDCNIPGQFRMGCIPHYTGDPFAQSKGDFDPGKGPLLKKEAFEGPTFNFEPGTGTPITNERGFAFKNWDFSIVKNTPIGEYVNFQFRAEFFNVWNWHSFTGRGTEAAGGGNPFTRWVDSPDFGYWNGGVSEPRTIQLGIRLEF